MKFFFKIKPSIRISCINIKCAGTNKDIILGAHMFNQKKLKKPSSGCSIQIKPPVTMELKVRVNFFGTKMIAFSGAKS